MIWINQMRLPVSKQAGGRPPSSQKAPHMVIKGSDEHGSTTVYTNNIGAVVGDWCGTDGVPEKAPEDIFGRKR